MKNNSFAHYDERRTPMKRRAAAAQSGNAMIYVLIVIALFAALSFTLSRNADTGEGSALTKEKVNIAATRIMQDADNIRQAIERMTYTGLSLQDIDFTLPSEAGFDTEPPPLSRKLFHPAGGGLTLPQIPADAIHKIDNNTPPAWYISRFNDVAWSRPDSGGNPVNDVFITAHQIDKAVCERINQLITGDPTIPRLSGYLTSALIESPRFHSDGNVQLSSTSCTVRNCHEQSTLCVSNNARNAWSFYSLLLAQPTAP